MPDNKNLQKLHSNMPKYFEGFNVPYEQFSEDMYDRTKFSNLHRNLSSTIKGFNVPFDQFQKDMGIDSLVIDETQPPTFPPSKPQDGPVEIKPKKIWGGVNKPTEEQLQKIRTSGVDTGQGTQKSKSGTFIGDIAEKLGIGTLNIPETILKGFQFNTALESFFNETKEATPEQIKKVVDITGMPEEEAAKLINFQSGKSIDFVTDAVRGTEIFEKNEELISKLEDKSDRYDGQTITELWKEDKPAAIGASLLAGAESLPQTLAAAFGGPIGLGALGFGAAGEQYDQLSDRTDMKESTKLINATLNGGFEVLTEYLGSRQFGDALKSLYKSGGKEVAEQAIKEVTENFYKKALKKYGLLFAPVGEGIEEMGSQFASNATAIYTGEDVNRKYTDGVMDAFGAGMGGGTFFTAAAVPGLLRQSNRGDQSLDDKDKIARPLIDQGLGAGVEWVETDLQKARREKTGKVNVGAYGDQEVMEIVGKTPEGQLYGVKPNGDAITISPDEITHQVDLTTDEFNNIIRDRNIEKPFREELQKEAFRSDKVREIDDYITTNAHENGTITNITINNGKEYFLKSGDINNPNELDPLIGTNIETGKQEFVDPKSITASNIMDAEDTRTQMMFDAFGEIEVAEQALEIEKQVEAEQEGIVTPEQVEELETTPETRELQIDEENTVQAIKNQDGTFNVGEIINDEPIATKALKQLQNKFSNSTFEIVNEIDQNDPFAVNQFRIIAKPNEVQETKQEEQEIIPEETQPNQEVVEELAEVPEEVDQESINQELRDLRTDVLEEVRQMKELSPDDKRKQANEIFQERANQIDSNFQSNTEKTFTADEFLTPGQTGLENINELVEADVTNIPEIREALKQRGFKSDNYYMSEEQAIEASKPDSEVQFAKDVLSSVQDPNSVYDITNFVSYDDAISIVNNINAAEQGTEELNDKSKNLINYLQESYKSRTLAEQGIEVDELEEDIALHRIGKLDEEGRLFISDELADRAGEFETLDDLRRNLSTDELIKLTRNATKEKSTDTGTEASKGQENVDVINQRASEEGRTPSTVPSTEVEQQIEVESTKVDTNPTEAQKEAGNYSMGHVNVQGFDITIENPKGSVRSGTDSDGETWESTMNNTYGYIKKTTGKDGDNIDVFLGNNPDNGKIYIVDQVDPKTKTFDEHKVMLGFDTIKEAQEAYLSNYDDDWQGLGEITNAPKEDFDKWLGTDTKKQKPYSDYKAVKESQPQFVGDVLKETPKKVTKLEKLIQKKSDLEDKLFDAKVANNEKLRNNPNAGARFRSAVSVATNREDAIQERIDKVTNEIESIQKSTTRKIGSVQTEKTKSESKPSQEPQFVGDILKDTPQRPTTQGQELDQWVNDHSNDPLEIKASYDNQVQNTPENKLSPLEQEVLTKKVNRDSFINFSDKANITQGISKNWFVTKEGANNDIDVITQDITESTGQEVTPDMIVDVILKFPDGFVRKTTNLQTDLAKKYKEITGESIKTKAEVEFEENVPFKVKEQTEELTPNRDYLFETLPDPDKITTKEEIAEYNAKIEILDKMYKDNFLGEDYVNDIEEEWVLQNIGENRFFEEIVEEKLEELDQLEQSDLDSGEESVEDYLDSTDIPVSLSIEDLVTQSKGTTEDLGEAGYILQDGTLLDFSGKRNGGPGGVRYEDHRQLAIPINEDLGGTDLMNAFMRTTGAIRMDYNGGAIDLETKPTVTQLNTISRIIRDNKDTWTIDLQDGERSQSLQGGPTELALDNIERFFTDKTQGTGYNDVIAFKAKPLYSNTEKALTKIKQEKGNPDQWKAMLLKNGSKQAELDWMGFREQFPSVNSKVTKGDIQEWIDQNKVQIEEVEKGDYSKEAQEVYAELESKNNGRDYADWNGEDQDRWMEVRGEPRDVKYSDYQLPGGSNYKELLLTMPNKLSSSEQKELNIIQKKSIGDLTESENLRERELLNKIGTKTSFKSSHFDEANILAHIRFNERFDNDGNKVLFIEEIQSDWAQEGRKKGFKESWKPDQLRIMSTEEAVKVSIGEGVWGVEATNEDGQQEQVFTILKSHHPTKEDVIKYIVENKTRSGGDIPQMPFKQTRQWLGLAFKRMTQYAAENGFDKIAWTTGEQQADRYDLSNQLQEISTVKLDNGEYNVLAYDKNGKDISLGEMPESELENNIGKDLTKKVIEDSKAKVRNKYTGLDLKVGGEGMKAFYDNILPKTVNKFGKKFGAKVENIKLRGNLTNGNTGEVVNMELPYTVQSLPLTESLTETALQGLPMFKNIQAPIEPTFAGEFADFSDKKKTFENSVKEIADEYSKELNSKVNVVQNEKALPASILTHMRKSGIKEGTISGVYYPTTGEVYIMTDYLDSTDEAKITILHEIVGHKGLRGVLGSKYTQILDDIYKSMSKEDIDRLSKLYNTKNKRIIADEYLAEQAEKDNKPTFIQKAISEIKALIRKIFGIKYSDSDIDVLLAKSRDYLRNSNKRRNLVADEKVQTAKSKDSIVSRRKQVDKPQEGDVRSRGEQRHQKLYKETKEKVLQSIKDHKVKKFDGKLFNSDFDKMLRLNPKGDNINSLARELYGRMPNINPDIRFKIKDERTRIEKTEDKLNKKIEETDREKETHYSYTLIKKKIKDLKTGYKLGSLDTQEKIKVIQKDIVRFARKNMPLDEARKSDINKLLSLIINTKNPAKFDEIFNQINELGVRINKRSIIPKIDQLLRKNRVKKANNKPVGKLDPDAYLVIDKIRSIRKLEGEAFDEYIDNIDDENIEEIGYAAMFGNLQDKSLEELTEAHELLTDLVDEGKIWYKEKLEKKKEHLKDITFKTVGKISGGKGILAAQEYKGGIPIRKGVVDDFINQNQSFEWLLDKLSKDKTEETGQGWMQEYFGDLISNATNKESKGIFEMTEVVHNKAAEIFGKDKKKLARVLAKNSIKDKNSGVTFATSKGKRSEVELSQNEAYKRWMEWQDPTLVATFDKMGWDEQTWDELNDFMTPQIKKWAKWQLDEFYPMYHKGVNEKFRENYFANLPFNEKYSPIRREVTTVADKDDALLKSAPMLSGVGNASLKSRIANVNHLQLLDGDKMLINHINEMEHFKAWVNEMRELRSVFGSRAVQHVMKYEHGNGIRGIINKQINDFASGGIDRSNVVDGIDKVRRAFVTAELGLNYTLFPKQLISALTYMSEMPIHNYLQGMTNLAFNMRTAINTLKESETVKERYRRGWTHEVKAALQSNVETKLSGAKSTFNDIRNVLMIPTKLGDFGGILGGWTVYHHNFKQQKNLGKTDNEAHTFALNKFERAISRSQQSSRLVDTGELQKGSWGKLFTMFKNSQQQYFRYESAAFRNLIKGRGSVAKNIKLIVLYHAVLPIAFQAVANAFSDDDKETEYKRLVRAGIMGSYNGILIASDIIEFVLEKAMGEKWSYSATPLEGSVNNIGYGAYNLSTGLKDMDVEKIKRGIEQLAYGINNMTIGLPYRPTKKIVKQVKDKLEPERVEAEEVEKGLKAIEKLNKDWRKAANKLDEFDKQDYLDDYNYITREDLIKDTKRDIKIEQENLDEGDIDEKEFQKRKTDIINKALKQHKITVKGLLKDYKERLDEAKRNGNKKMQKKIQTQIDNLSEI